MTVAFKTRLLFIIILSHKRKIRPSFFKKINFKQLSFFSFRPCRNGYDDTSDADCHVRGRPPRSSKSLLRLLPGHLDGGLHPVRLRLHPRVHRGLRPHQGGKGAID